LTAGPQSASKDPAVKPQDDINVRILMDDAMMLANSLSDNSLDGLYILNPDPWHKKRHHKRRIVNRNNLEVFSRILKPGGQLICSTDVPYLAEWMITETMIHGGFEWQAKSRTDWSTPPDDWTHTAYESKRAKGADKMVYLFFTRSEK
jgi:tRNA (guanine-N7-)-methyltransferase